MRRPRVKWMTRADDRILEFLQNEGSRPLNSSPAFVEANINYKISHIRTRMRKLHEAGFVEYYDENRGVYTITDLGCAYLAGEMEEEHLRKIKN